MQLHISEYVLRSSVIELKGRVDLLSTPKIKLHLNDLFDAGLREFVIDLSYIQFIDCAGLSTLFGFLKRTRSEGGRLRLILPKDEEARRILTLTHFDRLFELADSTDQLFPKSVEKVHSAPAIPY